MKGKEKYNKILKDISESFSALTDSPAKKNMVVMMLHDFTGVKKKDIKLLLDCGPNVYQTYSIEQDFKVNKNPKAKQKKS